MIEALSTWAEQIIVAVIIAGIIEMCLPSGNNKKYIKAVLGVYILFTIISPVIGKFTSISLNDIDYEKYFEEAETSQTISDSLINNNDMTVSQIYVSNLKQDMKSKLKEKGYEVEKLDVKTEDKSETNYGQINEINLTVYKVDEKNNSKKNEEDSIEQISKVENIKIGNTYENNANTSEKNTKKELSNTDKNEIKEYLSSVYEVKKKNIKINES